MTAQELKEKIQIRENIADASCINCNGCKNWLPNVIKKAEKGAYSNCFLHHRITSKNAICFGFAPIKKSK